ncbi:queuosine precursor transporter [Aureibaculum sp. 2210JD6-5]|uniref:queuosine precursor transporter n=1 Tax=Aureibaculum sp. 2210JD6-5 TaxID=3103957 RepID=UPI002AAC4E0D|nr:queuosine precursor transporter [Aureibaculum sp. 2210JD6-5]MDY7396410.1 queuosine precursor transporter [Aureibaculum sp. 2210JD6-5]
MQNSKKLLAYKIYMVLAALFITSLVVSNLIFQKFFSWDFLGVYTFEISVGILPYPITFLVTDLISEIYGKKKANQVVIAGIFASFFSLLIIYVADVVPATSWSPVDNTVFTNVFGLSVLAVFSSMIAYLLAQFVDIRIYHYWKKLTKGRHLWLRNNFSTVTSQFLDTFSVLFLLCSFGIIEWDLFGKLLLNGFLFKVMVAFLDTPILYIAVHYFRKLFNLKVDEEIDLDT